MKIIFVPAKIKSKINTRKIQSLGLPKNIAIAYSIQYKDIAEKIKKTLSDKYSITGIVQVLGCSKPIFPKSTEAVLLVTSGRFHAVALAVETKLPVYILESNKLKKVSEEEIYAFEKRKHASYMQFLNAEKVGILVSTKPGQENLKKAIQLKNRFKDKESYLFLANEIDTRQFENFPIEAWVNTACPRMDFEGFVFNMDNLENKK